MPTPANAINESVSGIVGFAGSGFVSSPVTQHDVLVGGATSSTITSVGPGTALQVLQSGGAGSDPAYSTATYPATTTINRLLYSSSNNVIGQITAGANGVLISDNSSIPSWLANGTAGQVLTANTGAPPSWQAGGGGGTLNTLTPDSGTSPVLPTGGTITIAGSGSITTVGGTNVLTVGLTGLTNHAVLIGAGTATITKVGPSATSGQVLQSRGAASDPSFSTAVYPTTTTVSEILYSSSANVITGITSIADGVLITSNSGVPSFLSNGTTGQVLKATTGSPPSWGAAAGTGTVVGPASSTDRAIATWNGTGGTALFDNSSATITSAGIQRNTLQPAFQASQTVSAPNATGDGTNVIISFAFVGVDQGSNFSAGTTFTCPVTGIYQFFASVGFNNLSAGHVGGEAVLFVNGSRYTTLFLINPYASQSLSGVGTPFLFQNGIFLGKFTAADTIQIQTTVYGSTKTVTVSSSIFSGMLLC